MRNSRVIVKCLWNAASKRFRVKFSDKFESSNSENYIQAQTHQSEEKTLSTNPTSQQVSVRLLFLNKTESKNQFQDFLDTDNTVVSFLISINIAATVILKF